MCRRDFAEISLPSHVCKKAIPLRPRQRLEIAFSGRRFDLTKVHFFKVKRQPQLFRQLRHKPRVLLSLRAANPVLQMRDFEVQLQLLAQIIEKVQQRHRIGPAGNGDQHPVARSKLAGVFR